MRKRIAVFMCAISFGNQRRVLEGILRGAKKHNMDIFVFTCHVNYANSDLRDDGAFSVMLLPEIETFDGVIIMKNTIRKPEVAEALVKKILHSGVVAVSVEEEIDGMHYVGVSNYHAQKQIVEHLIHVHHIRKINYITGMIDNHEGQQRLKAFLDMMEEAGLPVEDNQIFRGNYMALSGREAARTFLANKEDFPEAIVCGNDAMAMGVIEELQVNGYQVPGDVVVTGFDNDTTSHYCQPTLTTADQNQEMIGERAIEIIIDHPQELQHETVKPGAFYGESCGCATEKDFELEGLRKTYTAQIVSMQQAVDNIKNMSMELSGLDNMEELFHRLKKYVLASDMKSFYLCLKGNETDQIQVPLVMHHREFEEPIKVKRGEVLPRAKQDTKEPGIYIVTPLYYETSFGYCIQEGSYFALESELAYSWVVNVGNAMENIRKIRLMQQMVDKLNSMWMFDTLTNIYNRGGFYHFADTLLAQWKEEDKNCYILFLDLDGLKKINDGLGHEYGDACIKSMAEILSATLKSMTEVMGDAICMRYGGDEFVALGECRNEQELEQLISLLRENIVSANRNCERFEVSCSIGSSFYHAKEIVNLNLLLEEADKNMYEEKKKKHTRIGEDYEKNWK